MPSVPTSSLGPFEPPHESLLMRFLPVAFYASILLIVGLLNNLVYANTNQGVLIQGGSGARLVDNTVATPISQRPLAHGAELVGVGPRTRTEGIMPPKKKVTGLSPNAEYTVLFSIDVGANLPPDGIGGGSLYLKAGATLSRTADDMVRYHGKVVVIDQKRAFVLGFKEMAFAAILIGNGDPHADGDCNRVAAEVEGYRRVIPLVA